MASPLIVGPQQSSQPPSGQLSGQPSARGIEVAESLRDFYQRSYRMMDRIMTAKGVSYSRARLLMIIAREGRLRSTDLATLLGVTPRTVTEAIDGLERDGLARREPDPDDRRAKWILLTAQGQAAVQDSEAARLAHVDDVFGVLDPDEQGELIRLLGKLNDRLLLLIG